MNYSLVNQRRFASNDGSKSDYYIIDLALNEDNSQLGTNLSNELIEIIDTKTLQTITTIKDLQHMNHMIKYWPQSKDQIIVSSFDAIYIYDLRHKTSKISKQFKVNLNSSHLNAIHMTCFDFNSDYSHLVAGTELCEDKRVYIYLWDIRKPALIVNSYSESHTEDITDLCFHPKQRNLLASGSCDQLINIFDTNHTEEDEALVTTLNIENAVDKIYWTQSNDNQLICLTQEECIQLWHCEEVVPKLSFSALSPDSKFDYAIDVLPNDLVCVGDKSGSVLLFDINSNDSKNVNEIQFKGHLSKGHNQMVRTVCSASSDSVIYSGAEDGLICVWDQLESTDTLLNKSQSKTKNKMKRKEFKHRLNPY